MVNVNVNALFSSCMYVWDKKVSAGRQSGWEAVGVYERECERSKGDARMIPKLLEIHVLRDS